VEPLTATERRIWELLSDGELHPHVDLLACIDPLATLNNLKPHLSRLRRKLPDGWDIVSVQRNGRPGYRVVIHPMLLQHIC
jgi:hypothetical protein